MGGRAGRGPWTPWYTAGPLVVRAAAAVRQKDLACSMPAAVQRPAGYVMHDSCRRGDKERAMQHAVRGVIAPAKGSPVEVTTVVVPAPGPGEVVVRVQACGVCHTDVHYRDGGITDEFPFRLGHEAAGVVEEVGDGVTDVTPGDFVILNWRAVCGACRACRRGRPWYCFSTHNAAQPMRLADGTALSPALGIGAFAEKTLVHAGQCTKVFSAKAPMPSAGDRAVPSASLIGWAALCVLKQYQGLPRRQARQAPHTARQFKMTKSPGVTSVTPSPTSSTTPAASCPSRNGNSSVIPPSR